MSNFAFLLNFWGQPFVIKIAKDFFSFPYYFHYLVAHSTLVA